MTASHLDSQYKRNAIIIDNALLIMTFRIVYLFTRLLVPPIVLSFVSLEEYGIWSCCFILIGYIGMGAFGVSNVYVRYVAEYQAKGQSEKINKLLSTGLTVVSSASALLLIFLWYSLPPIIKLFRVSSSLHYTAFVVFFYTTVVFLLGLSFGGFRGILEGAQRYKQNVVVDLISCNFEVFLIVLFLLCGHGIYSLLWAYTIRVLIEITAYAILCHKFIPTLSLSPRYFDRESVRLFTSYGGVVQITGLLSTLLGSIEKTISGFFIGPQATALYEVGEKFPTTSTSLPSSINAVILPAISYIHGLGNKEEIIDLYLRSSKYVNMMAGFVMGYMAPFAVPIITCWLGSDPKFRTAASILAWFTLPYQLHVLTGPGSMTHRGVNKPVRELVYHISQLLLILVLVPTGFGFAGKTIMAINVTVASSMIVSAIVYYVFNNRVFGVSQLTYCWKVLIPGLIPYFFGFLLAHAAEIGHLWAGINRWRLVLFLASTGSIYSLLTGFFLYRIACDDEERAYLRGRLEPFVKRFLRMVSFPSPSGRGTKGEGGRGIDGNLVINNRVWKGLK